MQCSYAVKPATNPATICPLAPATGIAGIGFTDAGFAPAGVGVAAEVVLTVGALFGTVCATGAFGWAAPPGLDWLPLGTVGRSVGEPLEEPADVTGPLD